MNFNLSFQHSLESTIFVIRFILLQLGKLMTTLTSPRDSTELPLIVTDHLGIVIRINTAFEETYGWSAPDLVGQPLTLILPSYFQDSHHLGFARFNTTGISTILNHPLQLKVVTKDQQEVDSEHLIIAEKQGEQWIFAATLRPLITKEN